jgi:hypothetical protein
MQWMLLIRGGGGGGGSGSGDMPSWAGSCFLAAAASLFALPSTLEGDFFLSLPLQWLLCKTIMYVCLDRVIRNY